MKIIQLQYFAEVVKTNNISKAAKNLYVSQPAISAAIRELEKEFNTSLFIRYNNQITLTDEGHYLYRLAMGLLDNYEKVKSDMFAFLKQFEILKIGIPPMLGTFILPSIINAYTKQNPNVEIQLLELGSKANRQALIDREINMGLTVKSKDEELPEPLTYTKLMDTTLLFSINSNHQLAKKEVITINELKDFPLILMKSDCLQPTLVENAFAQQNLIPNVKIKTNQLYTIKELIKNNNLGAFLFNQVIENEKEITGIKLSTPIDLEIVLAYRKDVKLNNISKDFIDCIIESINGK
jgi:DNA-binding transcriptional LysR family regulator